MPTVQASYTNYMRVAVIGMIADQLRSMVQSMTVVTTAGIPFGSACFTGSLPETIDLVGGGGTFVGAAYFDPTRSPLIAVSVTPDRYFLNDTANVMLKGTIYVTPSVDVTHGLQASYVTATGAWAIHGTGSSTDIPNSRWLTDTTVASGQPAKLQLL